MREEKQLCHLTVISTVKNKTEDVIYRRIGGTILWLLYQILLLYCITVYPTNTLRPVSTVLSHHKTLLCLFFLKYSGVLCPSIYPHILFQETNIRVKVQVIGYKI